MLVTTPNHMINITQILSFPPTWALFQAQAAGGGEPPWAAAAGLLNQEPAAHVSWEPFSPSTCKNPLSL